MLIRIVPLNPHTRSHVTYVARTIASLLAHGDRWGVRLVLAHPSRLRYPLLRAAD
jgi:hypothetical protein